MSDGSADHLPSLVDEFHGTINQDPSVSDTLTPADKVGKLVCFGSRCSRQDQAIDRFTTFLSH